MLHQAEQDRTWKDNSMKETSLESIQISLEYARRKLYTTDSRHFTQQCHHVYADPISQLGQLKICS